MRLLVRSQPRMIPYHKCACASADTVGFIDDTIANVKAGDLNQWSFNFDRWAEFYQRFTNPEPTLESYSP